LPMTNRENKFYGIFSLTSKYGVWFEFMVFVRVFTAYIAVV